MSVPAPPATGNAVTTAGPEALSADVRAQAAALNALAERAAAELSAAIRTARPGDVTGGRLDGLARLATLSAEAARMARLAADEAGKLTSPKAPAVPAPAPAPAPARDGALS